DLLQFFAELASVLDLGDDFLGNFFVTIEEMEQLLAHAVYQFGSDFSVAQFVFGLRFENRIFEADGNRANHALADVVAFEFLLGVFVDSLEQAFAEGAQVRATVGSILPVDEGVESFAIAAVGVSEAKLQRLFGIMQRRINRFAAIGLQIFHHQIEQAVARLEGLAVINELEAGVEIAVM